MGSAVAAIEGFSIACAFLAVPPAHLQQVFLEAFSEVKSYAAEAKQRVAS